MAANLFKIGDTVVDRMDPAATVYTVIEVKGDDLVLQHDSGEVTVLPFWEFDYSSPPNESGTTATTSV